MAGGVGNSVSGEELAEYGLVPLFSGIQGDNIEVLGFLLAQGADPRETYEYEGAMLPIHGAVSEAKRYSSAFCQHHTIGNHQSGACLDISGPRGKGNMKTTLPRLCSRLSMNQPRLHNCW